MFDELKLDLMETGTRYRHYSELREIFATGMEILKNLNVQTPADRTRIAKLGDAVEMIDGRINFLADFDRKTSWGSEFRREFTEIRDIYIELMRKHDEEKRNADLQSNCSDPKTSSNGTD